MSGSATAICKHGGLRQEIILMKQSQEVRTPTFFPQDCFQGLPKLQTPQRSQGSASPIRHAALESQVYRDAEDVLFPI